MINMILHQTESGGNIYRRFVSEMALKKESRPYTILMNTTKGKNHG